LRILLTIHHRLERDSGAPGSTLALADAYRRAGHETELLSFDDLPRGLTPQAQMLAFPVLVASRLTGSLGRWSDVVDASSGDAWLWSTLPKRWSPRPLLVTRSHGLEHSAHLQRLQDHRDGGARLRRRYFLYHGGERLWEVAISFRRADLALFLNRFDLDYAVRQLGVRAERAHVVRNGIDDGLLGLPEPNPTGANGGVGIAMLGRVTREKGVAYSVPALSEVLSQQPAVRVSLLGTGVGEGNVLAAFSHEVRDRVTVVPEYARQDLPRLLAGHEIVVSATLTEGFGKALLEAMACGLAPVVASAAGPLEFIDDGRNGLIVPSRDESALIDATTKLVRDAALRLQLRRAAYHVAQNFSWSAAASQRLELFEAALRR
jgi:glycosyltransferase involved in cell wall biosynthesis